MKFTSQAMEAEPVNGVDDQKLSDAVAGKAVASISAAVAGWEKSTSVCSSLIVGTRQPLPPRVTPAPSQAVLAFAQEYLVGDAVRCQVSLVWLSRTVPPFTTYRPAGALALASTVKATPIIVIAQNNRW